jgi:hypothetical protein
VLSGEVVPRRRDDTSVIGRALLGGKRFAGSILLGHLHWVDFPGVTMATAPRLAHPRRQT